MEEETIVGWKEGSDGITTIRRSPDKRWRIQPSGRTLIKPEHAIPSKRKQKFNQNLREPTRSGKQDLCFIFCRTGGMKFGHANSVEAGPRDTTGGD